jgi:uncharacterized protein (DUF983 family)
MVAGYFSQVSGRGIFGAFLGTVPRQSERLVTQLRRMRAGYVKKNRRPGVNCLSVVVFVVVVSFLYAYVITSYRSYLVVIILIIIIIIIAMYITSTFVCDMIF